MNWPGCSSFIGNLDSKPQFYRRPVTELCVRPLPVRHMKAHMFLALLLAFSCCRAADADDRMHPATQLFINNHKFGDTNGCSGDFGLSGHSLCGHPGHFSDVTWRLLRTARKGDVYQMTRKYPSDSAAPKTDTKEVTYSGTPLILWQDDYQRIILRPKP